MRRSAMETPLSLVSLHSVISSSFFSFLGFLAFSSPSSLLALGFLSRFSGLGSRALMERVIKALDYAEAPIKDLRGFQKLTLKPGEKGKAVITLTGEAFEYYDPSIDELSTRPGRYQILYGTSSLEKDLQSIDFVVK